jgi:hypothetical protein
MAPRKQQHLDRATVPKRILSLDGGGIRGILTLEYLGASLWFSWRSSRDVSDRRLPESLG